jgi:hypothetical protein
MPYLTHTKELPFAPLSTTSHAGAEAGRHGCEAKRRVMARFYRQCPRYGIADFQMVRLTGFPINIICARRSDLGCVAVGKITGPYGVEVNTWALPGEDQP